jgi:hypothetical protein
MGQLDIFGANLTPHALEVSAWMAAPPGSVALDTWTDVRGREDVMALDVPFPYGRCAKAVFLWLVLP